MEHIRFLSITVCLCVAISAAAATKTMTRTTVLYADSASLENAYNEGWCTDGTGEGNFIFAKKGVNYIDPETGDEVSISDKYWLNLKGKGAAKGIICSFRGVKRVEACFRSGSTVERYVNMDIVSPSGVTQTTQGSHDGTGTAATITSNDLVSTQSYRLVLSAWADQAAATSADCQLIYIKFIVTEQVSEPETTSTGEPWLLDPEDIDRGLVAYPVTGGNLVSWRLLGTDSIFSTTFNVYRGNELLNSKPLNGATCFLDASGDATSTYRIETLVDGILTETSETVQAWSQPYLNIPLDRPAGGTLDGANYEYIPGDVSVGDVDDDGQYEIFLKWDPSNQKDNSQTGYTDNVYIDCYKMDGTKLWRIDLGRNIRAGAHYTQYMVYDFDGDGRAEMACKTAPGTIDGQGNHVLMGNDDPDALYLGTSSKTKGVVTGGPEYLTMFDGQTGAEITTVAYEPARGSSSDWGKDSYFNRSERYLACVAYLDGVRPSLVVCRGYYQRASMVAYNFDGQNLTKLWARDDKTAGQGCYGEGAHSITVGDVDGDGCDEIIFGSACVDNNGEMLYRTGFGHGDALHLGDFDPDRPGLEIFMVHEETSSAYPWDAEFRDAMTGEVIWGLRQTGNDIGRGLCADMDSTKRGAECWPIADYTSGTKTNSVFDCKGNQISTKRPSVNFRIYWMGNLYEQVLEKGVIDKWRCTTAGGSDEIIDFTAKYGCGLNLIKDVPALQADILGDWREEVIYYDAATKSNLMIFPTTYPTSYRIPCLMHDHTYRMAICWQNVAYNQPPHVGYYLPDYGNYVAERLKDNGTASNLSIQTNSDMQVVCTQTGSGLLIRLDGTQEAALSLFSSAGSLLWRTNAVSGNGKSICFHHWNMLPAGAYILKAAGNDKTVIHKLIK